MTVADTRVIGQRTPWQPQLYSPCRTGSDTPSYTQIAYSRQPLCDYANMIARTAISWLATSSAAITQARSVIDALRMPGVIDELGFLMLNGAFAERLYPGVTTIMTRARYLIFVPAIYRYMEKSRVAYRKDADRVSRDLQFNLGNALAQNEASFIGKESGRNLVRVPSNIYWSALAALGIANQRISEARYQHQLEEGRFGSSAYRDDDDAVHDEEATSFWTPELTLGHILPDGSFPSTTSFTLRRSEAVFLRARYRALVRDGHENLVSRMISLAGELGFETVELLEHPWDLPGTASMVSPVVDHARRLSLMARGATLQYYAMLLAKRSEMVDPVADAFDQWWDLAAQSLSSWNLDGFFELVVGWGAGRGVLDRQFIKAWLERAMELDDSKVMISDPTMQAIVRRRESYVRPGKQRLSVPHQLSSWQLPQGLDQPYQMDYRHRVGRRIALDIAQGLHGKPVA